MDHGEENSPAAAAGIRTRDLSITSNPLPSLSKPVLDVHRNHMAYQGRGGGGRVDKEGEEGDYIPIVTLSPPE